MTCPSPSFRMILLSAFFLFSFSPESALSQTSTPTPSCGVLGVTSPTYPYSDLGSEAYSWADRVPFPTAFAVTALVVYDTNTPNHYSLGLYDDDGTGAHPTTLMASVTYLDPGDNQPQTVALSSAVSFNAGYKWVAISCNASSSGNLVLAEASVFTVQFGGQMPSSYGGGTPMTSPGPVLAAEGCQVPSLTPAPTSTSCVNASNTPCTSTPTPTLSFTPTSVSSPTSTPTLTPTATPIQNIIWYTAVVERYMRFGTLIQDSWVYLQANNQPVTDATVYLQGTGISTPLTLAYTAPITEGGGGVFAVYYANGFTYQLGGAYSLTTQTSAGTASATLSAPGNITLAPDGSQASWTNPGNINFVEDYSLPNGAGTLVYVSSTNALSPFSIPVTAYPSPGIYSVNVDIENATYAVPGTSSSAFYVYDHLAENVTISGPTDTPTPTSTPCMNASGTPCSFTPTPTNTPTSSPTLSPTITPTSTQTPVPTMTGTPTPSSTFTPTPAPTAPDPGDHPYVYPNPATGGMVHFVYHMASPGSVSIKLWNAADELVATASETKPAGTQQTFLGISDLATGHYFYQVSLVYDSGGQDRFEPQLLAVKK